MTTRYRCKIRRLHADGTECTHKIKPSGRPLEPECPGRAGYEATCSCGADLEFQRTRAVIEEQRDEHLRRHQTRPVRTVELPDTQTEVH